MSLDGFVIASAAAILMVFGAMFVVKALTEQAARREAGVPPIVDVAQFLLAFLLKLAALVLLSL